MPSFSELNNGRAGFLQRRPFFGGGEHGAAEAAVFGFHVGEAGQHGADAQLRRFASVDSGEERIGEQVNHLGSVVALDHLGNGFVGFGLMWGMEPLAAMRILVRSEKSGESTVGRILVGTMNMRPSGMTTSLFLTTM